MSKARIGISGWTYDGWRNAFYPEDLPRKRELEYASRQFPTIEINGSFYSLQRPKSYRQWKADTPAGFAFAIKGSRFITHTKRLRDCRLPLANFFASGVLCLEEKMGPFLWQLPPTLRYDPDTLDGFFSLLPRTTEGAAELAKHHDTKLAGERVHTQTGRNRRILHAIEVRHTSFRTPEFIELLRKHRVTLVFADAPKEWPAMEDITGSFVYIRLHGAQKMYAGNYPAERLRELATKIRAWRQGDQPPEPKTLSTKAPPKRKSRDVYTYFDNDRKAKAPEDARRLSDLLDDRP